MSALINVKAVAEAVVAAADGNAAARAAADVTVEVDKLDNKIKYLRQMMREQGRDMQAFMEAQEAVNKQLLARIKQPAAPANLPDVQKRMKDVVRQLHVQNVKLDKVLLDQNNINAALAALTPQIASMGAQLAKVMTLQWITIGLELVNVAVSVAGFVIMAKKMDRMSLQLNDVAKNVQKIADYQFEFNVAQKCEKLNNESVLLFNKLANNKPIEVREVEELIKASYNFLFSLVDLLEKEISDELLQVTYGMLPVFTKLIVLYYEQFYEEHGEALNPLHGRWMRIFERLSDKKFQTALYDFYFLDQGMHADAANDVVDIQFLLNADMVKQIEDCIALHKAFSGEEYELARKEYEALVNQGAEDIVNAIQQPAVATAT